MRLVVSSRYVSKVKLLQGTRSQDSDVKGHGSGSRVFLFGDSEEGRIVFQGRHDATR